MDEVALKGSSAASKRFEDFGPDRQRPQRRQWSWLQESGPEESSLGSVLDPGLSRDHTEQGVPPHGPLWLVRGSRQVHASASTSTSGSAEGADPQGSAATLSPNDGQRNPTGLEEREAGIENQMVASSSPDGAKSWGRRLSPYTARHGTIGIPEPRTMDGSTSTATEYDGRRTAVLFGFLVIVVSVAFLVRAMMSRTKVDRGNIQEPARPPCLNSDCATHNDLLANRTSRSIDPCQDFGAYMCSSWKPRDAIPELALSTQSDLVDVWMAGLGTMLWAAAANDASGVAAKPLTYYESCTNGPSRDTRREDTDAFVAFLRSLGITWPYMPPSNTSALGAILELNYKSALPLWLSIRVVNNATGRGDRAIHIKSCCLGRLRFFAWHTKQATNEQSYLNYWASHYAVLTGNKSLSRDARQINEVAVDEVYITQKLADLAFIEPKVPFTLTLANIGDYTKRIPSGSWLAQINKHVSGDNHAAFTPQDRVVVSDVSVLRCLDDLFDRYTEPQLVDHLSWQFVQLYAWAVDDAIERPWSPELAPAYRTLQCCREVEAIYRPLLAVIYARHHLTPQQLEVISANFSQLVDEAANRFAASEWLDGHSKSVAVEKLRTMTVSLWPPEPFFDDRELASMYDQFSANATAGGSWARQWIYAQEVMRSKVGTTLHDITVNMRSMLFPVLVGYDYLLNNIEIAVSALAKPLYYSRGTLAAFYGGLGFVFTLAMMKIQDASGLKVLADHSLVEPGLWSWLSKNATDVYKKKMDCLKGSRVNLSDVAAFEVVYALFSRSLQAEYSASSQVSAREAERENFFKTLCLHSCAISDRSLPTFHCNQLLQNSHQFAEVFRCKRGSPMNPRRKCSYFALT